MRLRALITSLVLASATAACAPAYVSVTADVQPAMVEVSPGIWLVEGQPFAVYWSDGYYWRYDGGVWYRSTTYDSGFVYVQTSFVPHVVVTTYRPAHIHYRASGHVRRGPVVRDHRTPSRPPPARGTPNVRDHRRR